MEQWKDIKGYEGYYQVSDHGNVYSVPRVTPCGKKFGGHLLAKKKHNRGYVLTRLCKDGHHKYTTVHRLVAEAFIPNPNSLQEVNHIDEDKKNNHVSNLEWCTSKYNLAYGTRCKRVGQKHRKPVEAIKDGVVIARFDCLTHAAEAFSCSRTTLGDCCRGRTATALGLQWRYIG